MTYEYACPKCDHSFDVIKTVSEMDQTESCPKCGAPADRRFVPSRLHLAGTSVQHAEYNPAFGCVVKNKRHKEYLAQSRGMVEVGNDFKSGDSMQKHFDKVREEKREKAWEDV